uniref:Uncharacterized protein n=1 Tax=Cacopsylla melanoneura TaxID=428564 RepID=A0A8D8RQA9_9HEMI
MKHWVNRHCETLQWTPPPNQCTSLRVKIIVRNKNWAPLDIGLNRPRGNEKQTMLSTLTLRKPSERVNQKHRRPLVLPNNPSCRTSSSSRHVCSKSSTRRSTISARRSTIRCPKTRSWVPMTRKISARNKRRLTTPSL